MCQKPRDFARHAHVADENCVPRSVVTVCGTPNLAIQCSTKASAHNSAVRLLRGIASGHLLVLSMHVKR
jgi:hypothetical protein